MNFVAGFDQAECDLLNVAGGKGASLSKMYKFGLPVPKGFVVCAPTFLKFMKENLLFDKVINIINSINFGDSSSLDIASENIQNMIIEAPLSDEIKQSILKSYNEIGGNKIAVAVRSSSTAEDLEDASFAGQQETFLYVVDEEDVLDKIKRCWASLYNGRAIFYRKQKNFQEKSISIAVVVQKMINSEKSGVMFTVNPITKNYDYAIIEAAWGLGEGIVSGTVTPDSYGVEKNSYEVLDEYISEKELMVIRDRSLKGIEEIKLDEEKKYARVLTNTELCELVNYAKKLEAYFGKPQDVEWGIEGNVVNLLQSRPITTL